MQSSRWNFLQFSVVNLRIAQKFLLIEAEQLYWILFCWSYLLIDILFSISILNRWESILKFRSKSGTWVRRTHKKCFKNTALYIHALRFIFKPWLQQEWNALLVGMGLSEFFCYYGLKFVPSQQSIRLK